MAVDTMLLDVTRVTPAPAGPAGHELTAVVIFDGEAWIALGQDNGIVAEGESVDQAMMDLLDAIKEASDFARDQQLQTGRLVPEAEIRQFMLRHHEGRGPINVIKFQAP